MSRSPAASRRGPAPFLEWHAALLRSYGPQGWWPGRSRFEVVVGAILTQGVAWTNAEKAIRNLRRAGLLKPDAMRRAGVRKVARLIRPSGRFNQKARVLLTLLDRVQAAHRGRLDQLFRQSVTDLRTELLELRGIGKETADSIILYAAGKPILVVDAYTRRVLRRHGEARGDEPYDQLRRLIEGALPSEAALLNEHHALLVRLAKQHCKKRQPLCSGCPLEPHLPPGGPVPDPGNDWKLTQDVVSTRVTAR